MKALTALIGILTIPLFILNTFGAVVAGIWLAILRDWGHLIEGIVSFFVTTFVLGIALLPSLAIGAPALLFAKKKKIAGVIFFAFLANLYTLALVVLWCCLILFSVMREATAANYIPLLIWSYCIATGPWAYMARGEQGPHNEGLGASLIVFFSQLGYLAVMIILLITDLTFIGAVEIFSGFMIVALVLQIIMMTALMQEEARKDEGLEVESENQSSFDFENFEWSEDDKYRS